MRRIAPLLVFAVLGLWPAGASAVTVDFESPALSDGTVVSSQFSGVTFEDNPPFTSTPPLNPPALPVMRTSDARSASHTLDITGGGDEFSQPRTVGLLSEPRQSVTVWLRNVTPGSFSTVMQLKLYAAGNNVVATTTATVASSNPGYVQLTATSANPDVVRFDVASTTPVTAQGQEIRLDDLDVTGTSVTPDFSPSSSITGVLVVPQGKSNSTTIALNRSPLSNGNISFASTGGLPSGVTASFSPNPAAGTTGTTLVTFTASPSATLSPLATVTVTGTPAAGAGTQPRSVQFNISVRPPFAVTSTHAPTIELPPCSSTDIPLQLVREPTVDDAVSLTAIGFTGGPPRFGWSVAFDPSTLSGTASATTAHVSRGDTSGIDEQASFQGTAPGLPVRGTSFQLVAAPLTVSSVSTIGIIRPVIRARAPQLLSPGDPVLISGSGICPGARAEFGTSAGSVLLTDVRPGVFRAIVPRLAIDGRVTVVNPGGASGTSSDSVDIQTYRDTNGFSFVNATWTGALPEWEELFGAEQIRVTVDACFPAGCNVVTPTIRLDVGIYMAAWEAGLRGGNGTCVGYALGSRRILTGDAFQAPLAGRTLYDLPNSDALFHYLRVQHIAQASAEFMNRYLARRLAGFAGTITSASFRRDVEDRLRAGRPPMIILANGGSGHAVVAYDVEDGPGGSYFLRVYDSNFPADADERTNRDTRIAREQGSRIHITPDGRWTFFDLPGLNDANPWTGPMSNIVAIGEEEIPVRPTFPLSARGLVTLIFGSGMGSPGPGGTRATQSAASTDLVQLGVLDGSGIPAYAGTSARAHTFNTRADSRGRLVASALGAGNTAEIAATGPANGAARVSTLAGGDGVRYETLSPSTALRTTLTSRLASGETHLARFAGRSFRGGGDELAFDRAGKALTFRHDGAATSVTLDLASSGGRVAPSHFRGTLALKPGDRVSATPAWANLSGALRVTVRGRGGTRRVTVRNSVRPALVVRSVKATAKRAGARVLVAVSARLAGSTSGATETVAVVVTRGGKVVGRGSRVLTGGKVRRSTRLTLSIPVSGKGGGLRVRAQVGALSGRPWPASSSLKTTVGV